MAERYNRTLLDRLKPSLKGSSLHQEFLSDALDYAVWTTNRSPTRTNQGFKTPFEVYEGRPPFMHHAHVFGAKGIYLVPSANRKKLADHTRPCLFLGVLAHGDGVKVLNISTRKLVKTRDAFFDEENLPGHVPSSIPHIIKPSPANSPWLFLDTVDDHTDLDIINHEPNHRDRRSPEPPPPDQPNIRPQQNQHCPDRYGNIQAYSASLEKSPTYKKAVKSPDCESSLDAMKVEIAFLLIMTYLHSYQDQSIEKPYHVVGT